MKKLISTILLCHVFVGVLYAQNSYGIKEPKPNEYELSSRCGNIAEIFRNKSKEISFGVREDDQHNLYFQFNNNEWFHSLFTKPRDGIAVDVIAKSQLSCKIDVLPSTIRGEVLKPVFKNNLLKKVEKIQDGFYQVLVGKLPPKYYKKEVEFNIMMINNGYLCRYQTTYNLHSFNYQLLDMGLYLDSIAYNQDYKGLDDSNKTITRFKMLSFEIPFSKNQTSFSVDDIKPLYDSLRITDFNIKQINIKAYSSVEGSKEVNNQLQRKRAQSITKALQSFQKPSIETVVSTSENWVEFFNDIEGTQFDYLKELSKTEIKNVLMKKESVGLEKYLKNHRKALITLYLDKIDHYIEFSGNQLLQKFNQAIVAENFSEAQRIQNTLFQRMKSKVVNPDLLYQMEIPKQQKFLDFFNANSVFRYQINQSNILTSYYELEELNELLPNNKKISYNLVALKLKMNSFFGSMPNKKELLDKIHELRKYEIDETLIQRMLVNYHIQLAEELMKAGKYEEKDKSVQFILKAYKGISLSDSDYLSLAQFVTYYYDRETAIELIEDRMTKIDVDKKLLFYYLNLTLVDHVRTQDLEYRKVMLNAINIDENRFCKIFNSSEKGGVTFQLLKNAYLRNTYCENCLQ